jgi:dethiobiotin synthetase
MAGLSRSVWKLAEQEAGQEAAGQELAAGRSRASGVFVTATGTDVGKTIVAAVLARTLAHDGNRVAVFKPAFTGMDEYPDYDEAEARAAVADVSIAVGSGVMPSVAGLPDPAVLRAAALSSQTDAEIAPYRFDPPMSPHLAAGLAGVEIDPERVMAAARVAASGVDWIVCEGAGGLLVPLSPTWNMRALAVELGYPLVIVAPPGLGTINHTLLTVESARQVGLKIAAIVLNPWPADPTPIEADNREMVATLSNAPVLTLPPIDLTDPATWPALHLPSPPG